MRPSTPNALALLVCASAALAAPTAARAQSVVMTVDRPTTLNFMRAATPYSFEATAAGMTETFTLYNPRELVFEGGLIRLKIDCRGEPIPFAAVLEPTMSVTFDRQQNAFVARVRSLPIKLGPLGTLQLDQFLDPFVLPVSFSQTLEAGIPGLTIDYLIRDVKVLPDHLEARADLVFRKAPPPRASARK